MMASTIITTWAASSVWRLGSTSARTPANRPSTMTGRNCAVATTPSQERVAAERQHQPALGDLLHPGADQRHRLADEEQPVVAVPEGLAGLAPGEPSRREDRDTGHDRASRSGWGVGRPSISARWASRWTRRSRAASIIDRRRSALASRVAIWRSTRVRASSSIARRSVGSCVARKRSRLRSRAASSSSSWPIWASEKPGFVAQLLDVTEPVEVRVVVQPVGTAGAAGRLQQPDLFVVADGAGRQTGLGGDLLDLE